MKSGEAILREILGEMGDGVRIQGPIAFHYGKHTKIGKNVFANFNFTVQDDGEVTIGGGGMLMFNLLSLDSTPNGYAILTEDMSRKKEVEYMIQSRTHTCNQLRAENIGEKVTLVGWYENLRKVSKNLGSLSFGIFMEQPDCY